MSLPPRKQREPREAVQQLEPTKPKRWRSDAHRAFVRSHFCAWPGCHRVNTEAAHVRFGSHAGMSQKPDDWRCVPLCGFGTDWIGHHAQQHQIGEKTFWAAYEDAAGQSVNALIDALCRASPKAIEIAKDKREKENG